MHSSRLLLALTPILGALAADQVVTLNLPTDIGGSVTAAELIGSSASTTTLFIPCAENVTICQGGGVTLIAEPTAISMVVPLEDDVTYTASCSIDTSASTDSCVARTGTADTWEDMGTDDLSATEITITATATPASNSASPTTSPASTTLGTSSTSGSTASAETDDASASPSSSAVEATDSDGAAIAMMTAAPWAGAVVAGLAAAVARI